MTAASDTIVTVVTDDAAMRDIFAERTTTCSPAREGRIFVNCATVTPRVHVEVEDGVPRAGRTRSRPAWPARSPQARNGTLYLMFGGRREVFERVEPMLEKMSSSLALCRRGRRAAQVKALVNMVMNINTAGLAEGLGLGDALGLDLDDAARGLCADRRELARP